MVDVSLAKYSTNMVLPALQHIIPSNSLCICSVHASLKTITRLDYWYLAGYSLCLLLPLAQAFHVAYSLLSYALDSMLEWSLVHPTGAPRVTPPQIRPRFGINLQYRICASLFTSSPRLTDTGHQICCFPFCCVSSARTVLLFLCPAQTPPIITFLKHSFHLLLAAAFFERVLFKHSSAA